MSNAGMEENGQSQMQPQQPVAGPGAQLAARREALGWTVEQVANQLNLAPRQVQAMEDDNHAALPGIVIARGFVRAYAKLLKLDPAPLLALIAEKDAPSPESLELRRTLSATFTESSLPAAKRSGSGGKWLALVLLLAMIGAAGWLAWREGWLDGLRLPEGMTMPAHQARLPAQGASDAGNGEPLGQAEEVAQSAPAEPAVPQVPAQPPALAQPLAPKQTTPPATVPAPVAPPSAAATPASSATAAPAPAIAAAAASPAKSAEKLVLKMREASWIELKREDGSTLASRLVPAGASESFDVGPGDSLVVGNARGVDATYRGRALDLNADAKSNVARLKLK